jgi:signal peptidase II
MSGDRTETARASVEQDPDAALTPSRRVEWIVALAIVVIDQITKFVVFRTVELGESITVIPGLLNLTHVRNTGAAFGFLNAAQFPYKTLVITVIATVSLLAIAAYAFQLGHREKLARFGLALILGGAVGNLIDRVWRQHVVDFVDVYWREYHFWAFNVADAAITVGAAIVILDMLGIVPNVSKTV